MANPQKENGYTSIANELLEKIIASGLNGTELSVLFYIIRKTYGYNKKQDEISLSQFIKAIPVSKPTVCSALSNLQLVRIVELVKKGNSLKSSNLWALNKNYDEWQLVRKAKLVKKSKRTSKDSKTQLVRKPLHTKERIQKKGTKEISEQSSQTNKIINEFYDINPTINFGNITQRKATDEMIKKFGEDKLIGMIKWYKSVMTDTYCPVATTPLAFKNKLGDIKAYADKLKYNSLITEIKI